MKNHHLLLTVGGHSTCPVLLPLPATDIFTCPERKVQKSLLKCITCDVFMGHCNVLTLSMWTLLDMICVCNRNCLSIQLNPPVKSGIKLFLQTVVLLDRLHSHWGQWKFCYWLHRKLVRIFKAQECLEMKTTQETHSSSLLNLNIFVWVYHTPHYRMSAHSNTVACYTDQFFHTEYALMCVCEKNSTGMTE